MISKGALTFTASLAFASSIAIANHSWGNYHWERSQNPLQKELQFNLSGSWPDHFHVAVSDWHQSTVLSLSSKPGNVKSLRRCSPKRGEIQVCNEAYGFNGWLGIAGISVSGEHIESGYVKVNDSYFNSSAYNTPAWRQSVMCQEIGHIWGLGHNDENFNNPPTGTCMDYSVDPTANQHPDTHDYAMLESIYAHLDGGGGTDGGEDDSGCNPRSPKCNAGARPSNDVANRILGDISMKGPKQWGRLISGHGPIETFELDLGNGRKILTTVTWTLERANGSHDDH
jgi:hypothetical protein